MMIGMRGGPGTPDPTQLTLTNVSLMNVITKAYDVKQYQVTGSSAIESQLNSDRYDISAKIAPGSTQAQFQLMLQNMLAERFHLKLHRETKEFSGYELVVAKGGSKLKESSPEDTAFDPATAPPGPGRGSGPPAHDANGFAKLDRPGLAMMMTVGPGGVAVARLSSRAQTISSLLNSIGTQLGKPVVDKTGLKGKYDFTLEFANETGGPISMNGMAMPMPAAPAGSPVAGERIGPPPGDENAQPLPYALQAQLGLRLDAKKVQIEILAIEHADKMPTEN